jgi:hypothetical protein
MFADGTLDIQSTFDTSRQSFVYNLYRVSGNYIDVPATVWVNEVAPIWDETIFIDQIVSSLMTPIDLVGQSYVHSPFGDTINFTLTSGALPSGVTLTSNGVISGTPKFTGTYNFEITATDLTGAGTSSAGSQMFVELPIEQATDLHDGGTHVVRESHYNARKRAKIKAAKLAKQRNGRTAEQIAADEAVLAEYLQAEAAHIEKLSNIALNLINSLGIH